MGYLGVHPGRAVQALDVQGAFAGIYVCWICCTHLDSPPGIACCSAAPLHTSLLLVLPTSLLHFLHVFHLSPVQEKNVKIIDEEGLFSLVRAAPEPEGMEVEEVAEAAPAPPPASLQAKQEQPAAAAGPAGAAASATQQAQQAAAVKQQPGGGSGTRPGSFYGGPSAAGSSGGSFKPAPGAATAAAVPRPPGQPRDNGLWVEKYRPRTSSELVGNNVGGVGLGWVCGGAVWSCCVRCCCRAGWLARWAVSACLRLRGWLAC